MLTPKPQLLLSLSEFTVIKRSCWWGFPGGPVVKNPPSNAGDAGFTPGPGTKIPYASGQLNPCATVLERSPCTKKKKIPHVATKKQRSQK